MDAELIRFCSSLRQQLISLIMPFGDDVPVGQEDGATAVRHYETRCGADALAIEKGLKIESCKASLFDVDVLHHTSSHGSSPASLVAGSASNAVRRASSASNCKRAGSRIRSRRVTRFLLAHCSEARAGIEPANSGF